MMQHNHVTSSTVTTATRVRTHMCTKYANEYHIGTGTHELRRATNLGSVHILHMQPGT